MKKTIKLIVMILIMIIALTGCVNIDYEVTINKDGSGDITYIYGFEKDKMEQLEITPDDLLADAKENAKENNYDVENYEDDEIKGYIAKKHIDDITTGISLQEAFGSENVKDTEGSNISLENIKQGKFLYKIKYSQNAQIDLTPMEDSMRGMESIVTTVYKITLPETVVNVTSNASETSEDGRTLIWNLVPGEVNTISFEAITDLKLTALTYLTLFLLVALILIIVVIIYLNKKTNNKSKITKTKKQIEIKKVEPKEIKEETEKKEQQDVKEEKIEETENKEIDKKEETVEENKEKQEEKKEETAETNSEEEHTMEENEQKNKNDETKTEE